MMEWIIKGGPMMIPILICSVISLALIAERSVLFAGIKTNTRKFMGEVSFSLRRNRADEAIKICDQSAGPLPRVVKAGILRYDRPKAEIREAVENAALHEIPRLEKNVGVLATIAQISPLLGLLGTVIGLAEVFNKIQMKAGASVAVLPADISGGIWQALIATVAGLVVAIPSITAYNYFANKINFMVREMELGAIDIVSILSEKKAE